MQEPGMELEDMPNTELFTVAVKYLDVAEVSSTGRDSEGAEPRRLHLGTDIWGKPHDGCYDAVGWYCSQFRLQWSFWRLWHNDYSYTSATGVSFYTLYGHLSLNSIKNLQEGHLIHKGEIFAEFGIPSENGQWPPHLHFQIIADMQGWEGDYPGVCKFSEREKWLNNCPDPDLILQLNQFIVR